MVLQRLVNGLARLHPAAILVIGLLAHVAVLVLLPDQGFPDAKAYVSGGKALIETGIIDNTTYMPLYSFVAYVLGGGLWLHLFDIVLSLATVWMVRALVLLMFAERAEAPLAANGAALAWALWPHALFYAVSGLTETSYTFLLLAAFLLWYRRRYAWGSLLAVLSILVRPTGDLAYPVLLVAFILVVHRDSWRVLIKQFALYAAIYVVLLAPWWLHNEAKYGQFVRLNLGFGLVLYSGANPANTSGGGVNDDNGRGDDVDYSPFDGITDPIVRDQAMKERAIAFIKENPIRYAELAGVKFLRFWRLWPYASQYVGTPIIVASLASYGVFLAATLVFLIGWGWRHWRAIAPMVLFAAYLTAVHALTIGSIRYRFPLEPFLAVLGSPPIAIGLGRLAKHRGQKSG